jgi:carbamoyl-phosphate synthase/aspartate carbamoyltransferase/dihydroorotase
MAIGLATAYGQHLHVAHVTQASEIALIKQAKERGLRVTCEVAPHHLLLSTADLDRLGPYGYMKPELKPQSDVDALWANFDVIDCIADDHAPHTREEKESPAPPPGVPGLDTTLPLMFNAVKEGRITLEELLPKVTTNPRRIFNIPDPRETYAVIDLDPTYVINPQTLYTKVGWSPFAGMTAAGHVRRVVVRGQTVYRDGEFARIEGAHLVLGG